MIKKFIISFISCFFGLNGFAQIDISEDEQVNVEKHKRIYATNTWTWRTTGIVPLKEFHLGLTSTSRFGLSENMELELHLFLAYFIPNIGLKKRWQTSMLNKLRWSFASRHVLYYPTPGLKFLQKSGYENIIDNEKHIPEIFAIKNELIASYVLNPDCKVEGTEAIISGRIGIDVALQAGENTLDYLTFQTLFHRSSIAHKMLLPYLGLQLDRPSFFDLYRLSFTTGLEFFMVDFKQNLALENLNQLHYFINDMASLSFGVLVHLASNEVEKDLNIFPHFDFVYKFNRKGLQTKLFNKRELRIKKGR